jgi:lipopolysaccharide biosynthesis glycosyltransferase
MESKLNVLYATDENYAMYTGVSMFSLLVNNQDIDCLTLYILENNVSQDSKAKLEAICKQFSRKIIFLDSKNLFDDLASKVKMKSTQSITTYASCFLPYILDEKLDRILYIDGDSLVCGSLKYLCSLKMDDTYAYAVQDCILPIVREKINFAQTDIYINAGLLYMNLEAIRKANLEEDIKTFIRDVIPTSIHNDQDVINGVYKGHIKLLPANYNVITPLYEKSYENLKLFYNFKCYYTSSEIKDALNNPIFIHFTASSTKRPWIKGCNHPKKIEWDNYKSQTPWRDVSDKKDSRKLKKKLIDWMFTHLNPRIYVSLLKVRSYFVEK